MINCRSRLDTRQSFDAPHKFRIESGSLRLVFILCAWEDEVHCQQVGGIKAWISFYQLQEAANQQPGADEQHERKRDFGNDQEGAQSMRSRCALTPAFFECAVQIRLRELPRRG